MRNNNNYSQSTEAVNSAKTSFLLSATTMFPFFSYKKKEITELNKTDLVKFITNSICVCKTGTHFCLEFGDERYCIFLHKGDRGYYVTVDETSSKTVQRPVKEIIRHYCDCFRLTEKNIGNIANYIYDLVADYFYGVYEAETANTEAEISEAPVLEQLNMRNYNKINERTIEAVVGGAVVEIGPKAVLNYNDDMLTLFILDKVFSYPNDAYAVKNINGEISKYFYDKDAYVLDLPTRLEVYDGPKEYEDAKNEMAMQYVYNIVTERDLFEDAEWDKENAEVSVRLSIFNEYESMLIMYNTHKDRITLNDDYGNEVVVDYDVEDEDYDLFQEMFFEGYKELMAQTVRWIIENN